MRQLVAITCALLATGAEQAPAQEVAVKPLVDVRFRYEHVDQDGLPEAADAVTVRLRAGAEARRERWSALIEGEATLAPLGDYNEGRNGRTDMPLVIDPHNLQLNRALVRYDGGSGGLSASAGRQRIELLDQRFVGSAPFRQNDQTFDGVRVQWGRPSGVAVDVSYVRQALTVNGARGRGARQDGITGDNLFALTGAPTPFGRLSAFAFLVDQDEALVQGFQLSSQSYGVRLAGSRPLGPRVTLSYAASYARQRDFHRNPNRYGADYWLGEATVAQAGLAGTLGYEVLGAADGRALTSFQTPLSSLFKFQGWADKFTTTPPDGVRDLYAGAGYGWTPKAFGKPLALSGTWHLFESDRLVRRYGAEIDLLASMKVQKATFSARFAHYEADGFATDTDKLWLQVDWTL